MYEGAKQRVKQKESYGPVRVNSSSYTGDVTPQFGSKTNQIDVLDQASYSLDYYDQLCRNGSQPSIGLKTSPDWEASNACRSFYIGQSSKTGCLYDTPCYRKGRTPAATKSGEFKMR